MRRKLAAGNWKMNGTLAALGEVDSLALAAQGAAEVLVCPPFPLIAPAAGRVPGVAIGGQTCHPETSGAFTGEVSAGMLADVGASYVILGHSERREMFDEHDDHIRARCRAAWQAGLKVILCIGETEAQRDAQNTLDILGGQMAGSIPDGATGHNLVVAYEPIWAIGTGRTATPDQIGEVHDFIRARLERRFGAGVGRSTRLLYGGSVKPGNAAEIFAVSNVDGALVGGASLKSADFILIIDALNAASD